MDQSQPDAQAGYAKWWASVGAELASQHHYAWMVEQLGRRKAVLEIGCGGGHGTAAMVDAGMRVWGFDSDRAAVELTAQHLRSVGVHVEVVPFSQLGQPSLAQVRLAVADAFDEDLVGALATLALDAVVLWFVGATPATAAAALGKSVDELGPEQLGQYRDKLQLRGMKVAESLLSAGGIFHVVDRARVDWAEKDKVRQSIAAQMGAVSAKLFETAWRDVFLRKVGADVWGVFGQSSHPTAGIAKHSALCSIRCVRTDARA